MGGANAGEEASKIAAKTVKEYIKNNFIKIERDKVGLEGLVRKAIVEANKKVFNLSKDVPKYKKAQKYKVFRSNFNIFLTMHISC